MGSGIFDPILRGIIMEGIFRVQLDISWQGRSGAAPPPPRNLKPWGAEPQLSLKNHVLFSS